jgi:DNA-binding IclR family transcriptional regulator
MGDAQSLTVEQEGLLMSKLRHPVQPPGNRRAPSTARLMLKVLALLAEHPDGVRASDVARSVLRVVTLLADRADGVDAREVAETVGTSPSTAYYLLASLCEEGFVVRDRVYGGYRLRRGIAAAAPAVGDRRWDDIEPAIDALFLRTRKACYLGRAERGGIEILAVRGLSGLPTIPGLGSRIPDERLHALAMGKVVLSLLPDAERRRYVQRGLRSFTDTTITSPHDLMDELDRVRGRGVAIERGEFHPDFCCVAAPMHDVHGRFMAVIGLSTSTPAFHAGRERLIEAVRDAAAMSNPLQRTQEILRREGLAT